MGTFRYIFLLLYFLFHVFLVVGALLTISKIRNSDFKFINGFINDENLLLNSSNLIIFTILGLILFGVNALMIRMLISGKKKQLDAKDAEVVALKAKLYDKQGTAVAVEPPKDSPSAKDSSLPE